MTVGNDRLEYALGAKLREERKRLSLTMVQLSELSGISQPHLSQMENGKVSPSINSLYRLANALDISPQQLLPDVPSSGLVIMRAEDSTMTPISDQIDSARARVLALPEGRLQIQEVVVRASEQLGDWFDHEGEEFLFVLEGSMLLELKGQEPQVLEARDGAWYQSAVPHRWSVQNGQLMRLLAVSVVLNREWDGIHR